jgi:methylenetetrahydrofolate dehydrogenase (NADP+) / methenyltetrahydrofolate cyclohydrolase
MTALRIDGKALARQVQDGISKEILELNNKLGRAPCLAVILVGDNPASKVYVKAKAKNAESCGIDTIDVFLPGNIDNKMLEAKIKELNTKPNIDGILLQLPLPPGLDEYKALSAIDPALDVDGLHPINQGLLLRGEKSLRPCTPSGVIELIDYAREKLGLKRDISGLQSTVVGRSILVGKPVSLMLLERHCTVTLCHSRTKNLMEECRRADILVAAVGRQELIKGDWVKKDAIVIDVGINRTESGALVGDVDFQSVSKIAAAITPVPGGVGPMTIAMLLKNTLESAKQRAAHGGKVT